MDAAPLENSTHRTPRAQFVTIAIFVYCVAAIVHVIFGLLLAVGLQALGAAWGWWEGDPSITDASGYLTTGLVGFLLVAGAAAGILAVSAERFDTTARGVVLVGTSLLLAGPILLCAFVVA